jgi:hypothetical protein
MSLAVDEMALNEMAVDDLTPHHIFYIADY